MSAHGYRKLGFEVLENRLALAGNVTAVLSGTTLTITGDDASNAVIIRQVDPATIRVECIDAGGLETSLNGTPNGSEDFDLGGNLANLRIMMKGGDDSVVVGDDSLSDRTDLYSLVVNAGAGPDEVHLFAVTVQGTVNATITLGTNSEDEGDGFLSYESQFNGNLQIDTGGGGDTVEFLDGCQVVLEKRLSIDTGSGDDGVVLDTGGAVAGLLDVRLRDGDDTADIRGNVTRDSGTTLIDAGRGNDTVGFASFYALNSVKVRLGGDTNQLNASGLTGEHGVRIYGGSGTDTLNIDSVYGPRVTAHLYGGNDQLIAMNVAMNLALERADVRFDAGSGDDVFSTIDNVVGDNVRLNLGSGTNQVTASAIDANNVRITGGSGVDTVTLGTNATTTLDLIARLYGDDDVLDVTNVTVTDYLYLNGGPGTNKLNEANFTKPFGATTIVNFIT